MVVGTKDTDPDRGLPSKNARITSNVQDLLWCDARDRQGSLLHAPKCDVHDCFVVQGKKQETNTGGKAKIAGMGRWQCRCTRVRCSGATSRWRPCGLAAGVCGLSADLLHGGKALCMTRWCCTETIGLTRALL